MIEGRTPVVGSIFSKGVFGVLSPCPLDPF